MDVEKTVDEATSPEDLNGEDPHSAESIPGKPYVFTPLNFEGQRFRLFKIAPAERHSNSLPKRTMQSFTISSAPPYKAVSYTWGDVSDMKKILVNGQSLEISENLFDFLVERRSWDNAKKFAFEQTENENAFQALQDREEWLWADQICIDQCNVLERNHQVMQMGSIYSNAVQVLCWLGKGEDIESAIKEIGVGLYKIAHIIASSGYWDRLWIIQEFVLGFHAVIIGGAQQVSASDLRDAVENLEWSLFFLPPEEHDSIRTFIRIIEYRQRFNGLPTWAKWDVSGRGMYDMGRHLTWRNVMRFAKSADCTDIRDRVFGMLSLVQDNVRIGVDYQASRRQIRKLVLAAEARVYFDDLYYSEQIFEDFGADLNSALELDGNGKTEEEVAAPNV